MRDPVALVSKILAALRDGRLGADELADIVEEVVRTTSGKSPVEAALDAGLKVVEAIERATAPKAERLLARADRLEAKAAKLRAKAADA